MCFFKYVNESPTIIVYACTVHSMHYTCRMLGRPLLVYGCVMTITITLIPGGSTVLFQLNLSGHLSPAVEVVVSH